MTQETLVSIVINNYNYGRFLADAIGSALRQTLPSVEVIVVDDGSTDNSREVIASFGDKVVPLYKENGGQASAFNAGFAHSRGEVVIFLDADDRLLPRTAERVAGAFRQNPELAKVMYPMEIIDAAGASTGVVKPAPHLPLRSGDLRQHVLSFPWDMTWMATSGNAFAANVLRQILPMPVQEFALCADYYLSHLSTLHGPVLFLDEVGASYRLHGTNNHEVSAVDLPHIRRTIEYAHRTTGQISSTAQRLGLLPRSKGPADILSVSYVANRLVSLRLDPEHHPLPADTPWRLLWEGAVATSRRFDVGLPMKGLYLLWFALAAFAPKALAWRLAEWFYFPAGRPKMNGLLMRFQGRRERLRPKAN
ncbi:MAG: glycosyltransferase family 2 protein [Chloroflexota bacterium]